MEESFGAVAISKTFAHGSVLPKSTEAQKRKWVRKKGVKKQGSTQKKEKEIESSKRQLIDVMITEGYIEECGSGEKKRNQNLANYALLNLLPEAVLDDQHCLEQ